MGIERGTSFLRKWQPKLGLSDYRIHVMPLRETSTPFGESFFSPHQQWGVIWLPQDDAYPAEVQELIVLHELFHGVLWNLDPEMDQSVAEVERFCNRMARVARNDWATLEPEEAQALFQPEAFFSGDPDPAHRGTRPIRTATYPHAGPRPGSHGARPALDSRRWLNLVIDSLPPEERAVVNALYKEGLSIRQAADALGLERGTVEYRQRSALRRMDERFAALSRSFQEFPDGPTDSD